MTREEAVKSLLEMRDGMPFDKCRDWIEAISMAIRTLEAQQWIPCSERLPKKDGRYLCTYSDFGTCVDFGLYADGQWIVEPIAWMPLPEPWRGEKDE